MASIVVVGAGFAGMSVAARLAKLRHDVTIIDAAPVAGGRLLGVRAEGDFWARTPPSVSLPGVFRDLFRKSGRPMSAILDMEPTGPRRHVFVGRKTVTLDLPFGTRSAQNAAITEAFGRDNWSPWVDTLADSWDTVRRHVFERVSTVQDVEDVADRIGLRQSVHQAAKRGIGHRAMTRVALDRWLQVGRDPRVLPSTWNIWHYVERNFGRWRFDQDTDGLAAALIKRLGERKVPLQLDTPVRGVTMKFGRVTGVETDEGRIEADIVVWASGQPLADLGLPTFPRREFELTGVSLLEASLPEEVMLHGRTTMRLWQTGHRRWVASAPAGTDIVAALRALGVSGSDIVNLVQLRSAPRERPKATTSGSGLDLGLRNPSPPDKNSRAIWIPRPAMAPAEGLYVIGSSAVPGADLAITGMGSAAVAEAIGPAPRVTIVQQKDSDETL